METLVAELARRGKLLVGESYFEGGVPVTVERKGSGDASPGDLVVLRLGRGRARVEEVLGRPDDVGAVLEGLLWHEGARRPHGPVPPSPGELEPDRVDLRDLLAFTIDPDEAKDFDDALSFRQEGDAHPRAGSTSPTSPPTCRRARCSTGTLASAPSQHTSPGRSSRCFRRSSPLTSAACARTRTGAPSPSSCSSTRSSLRASRRSTGASSAAASA